MKERPLDDIEIRIGKGVWLSIMAGAVTGPVIFVAQLILDQSLLVALASWGVFALLPTIVLGLALLITTGARTCPRYITCKPENTPVRSRN
ncbi:MAG: hypothetical protein ACNA7O_19930 [Rhodobacterales bacterium]